MTTNGDTAPVGEEKINTNITTLTSFLTEEQTKHKEATGDFTWVQWSFSLNEARIIIDYV